MSVLYKRKRKVRVKDPVSSVIIPQQILRPVIIIRVCKYELSGLDSVDNNNDKDSLRGREDYYNNYSFESRDSHLLKCRYLNWQWVTLSFSIVYD